MPKGKTSPGGKKITKGAKITKKTKEISVAKTKWENLPELSKPLTRSKRSLATGDKQTPVKAKKQRLTGEKRPIDGCFKRVLNKELLAEAKAAKNSVLLKINRTLTIMQRSICLLILSGRWLAQPRV